MVSEFVESYYYEFNKFNMIFHLINIIKLNKNLFLKLLQIIYYLKSSNYFMYT